MGKSVKIAFLILFFIVGPFFIGISLAQSKLCSEMTAFKPRLVLTDIQSHSPRLIALRMNDDRMTRDLLALTGRTPVDCNGCITDRFQPVQKQRSRAYLIERIKAAGLEVKLEKSKLPKFESPSFGGSYGSGFGGNLNNHDSKFKAVNWDTISASDLSELWRRPLISDLRRYLIRYLKWEDDPEVLKIITPDMLRELIGMVDTSSDSANEKLIRELTTAGLNIAYIKMDSKQLLEALLEGDKKRDSDLKLAAEKSAKEKAAKEEARLRRNRESKEGSVLTQEDQNKVINIITEIRGSRFPDEIIEIIAHYDTKTENAAGADDNGSGLVTTLELMRLMKKYPPARTVRIIFSDREEIDSAGAEHHVKQIVANKNEKVVGVLVPDMFGYSPLGKPKFVLELGARKEYPDSGTYAQAEEFAKVMAKQWHMYTDRIADMSVLTFSAESEMGDHGAYWDKGIPAIFIAAPLRPENPANHTSRDKVENMNFLVFREVAHFLGEVLVRTAGSKLLATELPVEEDLAFLKRISRPVTDLNDKAVSLYFEGSQSKRSNYEPSPYVPPGGGSGYSKGYPGSNGFASGSSSVSGASGVTSGGAKPETSKPSPGLSADSTTANKPLLLVGDIDKAKTQANPRSVKPGDPGPILPKRDSAKNETKDPSKEEDSDGSIFETLFQGYRESVRALFNSKK